MGHPINHQLIKYPNAPANAKMGVGTKLFPTTKNKIKPPKNQIIELMNPRIIQSLFFN